MGRLEVEKSIEIYSENLKRRGNVGLVEVEGRIILKETLGNRV
jgi:hypothetical protein